MLYSILESENMGISIGVLFGLIAMFGWGIADFFAAKASREIGEVKTLLWMQITGFLLALLFLPFTTETFLISSKIIGFLAVAGLFEAIAYLAFYRGFRIGLISVVSPIGSSWAMVTVILSVLFLGEILQKYQGVGILFTILGVALVSTNIKEIIEAGRKAISNGVGEAVFAMLGWGIGITLFAAFTKQIGWFFPILILRFFMILTVLIFALGSKERLLEKMRSLPWNVLVFIGFLDVIAYFSLALGIRGEAASIVAPVSAAFPLVTVLLARIFLKEKLVPNQILGILSIIGGLVLLSL